MNRPAPLRTTEPGGEGPEEPDRLSVCPECGAAPVDGSTCQDVLHGLLERKYAADAAEYGLAVACYTLQHPLHQSTKALEWARFHLELAVQHGLPLADVRRAARARFDHRGQRAPTTPRPDAPRETKWRMTIVQLSTQDPSPAAGAAAGTAAGPAGDDAQRILLWARTILEDVQDEDTPA